MKILQRPDVRTRFSAEGVEGLGSTPEEFGAHIRNEVVKWEKVVKASGATVD